MSSWTQLSQFLRFFLPTFEFSLKIFSQVNEESGGGGGGGPKGGILAPYQMILVFAGEKPYMCTLSWYTSAGAQ